MSNNHILVKKIGDLRGFSTFSIFMRPSNVADISLNMQRAPDGTTQLRRGYQCQAANHGGLGIGSFKNPTTGLSETACIGTDGYLYSKTTKQIYLYYNGILSGAITNITDTNPAIVTSPLHGLQNGAIVQIMNAQGMVYINGKISSVTVLNPNQFQLDTVDATMFPPYTGGGTWTVYFTNSKYVTISIFTDPNYIYSSQCISCNITEYFSAQVNLDQTAVNTINVLYPCGVLVGDVVQFYDSNGVFQQRNVLAVSGTLDSLTIDGTPVSIKDGTSINHFLYILFGNGYELLNLYTVAQFLTAVNVFPTLIAEANGDTSVPMAFVQIFEPKSIISPSPYIAHSGELTLNYWYWSLVNFTYQAGPPFLGSADLFFQNSPNYENASFASYNDVLYITNGLDFPQKYDGQTVYRMGVPTGIAPTSAVDNTTSALYAEPFIAGNKYLYAVTYQQIDNMGNSVEGGISQVYQYICAQPNAAADITIPILRSTARTTTTAAANWNTNGASTSISGPLTSYGPDSNNFYYISVLLDSGYTLNIGDTAYYLDQTSAVVDGAQSGVTVIKVKAGHNVVAGDIVYFADNTATPGVERRREVLSVTDTSITIQELIPGGVSVDDNTPIAAYKTGKVYGDIAIVHLDQTDTAVIAVEAGHTIVANDIINFIDADGLLQERTVQSVTLTSIAINGYATSIAAATLIWAIQTVFNPPIYNGDTINIQRLNSGPATLVITGSPTTAYISNNLRINLYRTQQGKGFITSDSINLVVSLPNGINAASFVYTDYLPDAENAGNAYTLSSPALFPYPPPICKYLLAYNDQMFFAGGKRNNDENSNTVFFSTFSKNGSEPEVVPILAYSFNVPNYDDEITGIGVSGSTVIVTKNGSLWGVTGQFALDANNNPLINIYQIVSSNNIGCVAHATICNVGPLMYFCHTTGIYSITENQMYPTDERGNPIPLSLAIDVLFRETNFLPQYRYVFKRATAVNNTKDHQYLIFLPCEDANSTIRTANSNSIILCYDYQDKNWYKWDNMNAAGGILVINSEVFFQERKTGPVGTISTNFYKQHRFYRLIDHADHGAAQKAEWRSSWEDLGQPEVRKKFSRCVLLMDRLSAIDQLDNPIMKFSTYLDRIPNLQNTIADVTTVNNRRNARWSTSPWGMNYWSGYLDSFISINLRSGTVAKSMQVGFKISGINMDIRLAGFQLEAIPENRITVVR